MSKTYETKKIINYKLDEVTQELFESNKKPSGNWKKFWTMKLLNSKTKCKLPRGFVAKKSKKKIFYTVC